ncbi:MAG: winged helix-turn-helix domain-containing protein [Caldilineaceae bacterium]|nr:winged helix-turn-helix domain-containing protein [Caldilineaceae bacterium]
MHNTSIFARPSLQRIVQNLCAEQPVSVSLVGGPLLGKSAVLAHLAQTLPATAGRGLTVISINCAQVGPGQKPPDLPGAEKGPIFLLDNFHAIDRWQAEDKSIWGEWLAIAPGTAGLLLASRVPLYEIDMDVGGILPCFQQNFLSLIGSEEAERVVRSGLAELPDAEPLVAPLLEWCGGHPFLLDRIDDLVADVAGMLTGRGSVSADHLPLLRLRLAAVYGRLLFDSQWRAVDCHDEKGDRPVSDLLRRMLRGPLRFDEIAPPQTELMNWLLVQGMAGIAGHSYRLLSPLLQDYLALKLEADPAVSPPVEPDQQAVHALVERESHRFTPQEKSLLLYFLQRPGTIVSVDELLAEVWQRPDGSVRRVQEGIRRLRQRLSEFNGAVGTIDNEWGQGYRYVPVNGIG